MVLCSLATISLALMISALCKTIDMIIIVLPMALEVSRLFGGFLISPANLPKYFTWLDALSYAKYTYVGISLNELEGLVLSCAGQGANPCIPNGETTIKSLGLDYINIGGCVGALLAYIIFCQVVAYLGVRFFKN
jgi:ATP-binding cassette subfamily G (WHITE) protein 2